MFQQCTFKTFPTRTEGSSAKSVLLKLRRRGPTSPFDKLRVVRSLEPQQEPMGICFSAPKVLICQVHFPQAASVSDVSSASIQAPFALLNAVWFRRGKAEGSKHGDEKDGGKPRPLEKAAKGEGVRSSRH